MEPLVSVITTTHNIVENGQADDFSLLVTLVFGAVYFYFKLPALNFQNEGFYWFLILLCIVGGIVFYLYRAKKRGEVCIGCPYAKQCGGHCHSASGPNEEEHRD